MKILNIYTTYNCPFKCKFCFNLNKCDDNKKIDLEFVDKFLKKNSKKFDKIVITGGEPSYLTKSYIDDLIKIIKKYTDYIEFSSYGNSDTVFEGVEYNFSYDFLSRPRADVMWKKLLEYKQPFTITITLNPLMFRIPPHRILQTFNLLPLLRKVSFVPFFQSMNSQYMIRNTDYQKFMWYVNNFKDKLGYRVEYCSFPDEFNLTPDNKLTITQFNENEIRYEEEINEKDIDNMKTNYPKSLIV